MAVRGALIGGALALLLPLGAAADSSGPADGRWLCQSQDNGPTFFVSDVFDSTGDRAEIQTAFAQALIANYGYKHAHVSDSPEVAWVGCARYWSAPYDQSAEGRRAAAIRDMQTAAQHGGAPKVVEVHWSYNSADANLPYACYGHIDVQKAGQTTRNLYLTQQFRLAGGNAQPLLAAWRAHENALHPGFAADDACDLLPPDEADRTQYMAKLDTRWRMSQLTVVHDDWKYAGPLSAVADRGQGYLCELLTSDGKTWYVTPVGPAPAGFDANAASDQFRAYAHTTLGLDMQETYRGGCVAGAYAQREHYRAARKEQLEGTVGFTLREVSFTYVPKGSAEGASAGGAASDRHADTAVPAAAAPKPQQPPSAPAAKPPITVLCYYDLMPRGQTDRVRYLSERFESDAAALPSITLAWREYIKNEHHPDGVGNGFCNLAPSAATSRAATDAQLKTQHITPIHVDWKPAES